MTHRPEPSMKPHFRFEAPAVFPTLARTLVVIVKKGTTIDEHLEPTTTVASAASCETVPVETLPIVAALAADGPAGARTSTSSAKCSNGLLAYAVRDSM